MKILSLALLIFVNLTIQKSDNLTYTKVNLSNEFNIPYPNTKIKFSGKRTSIVTITDSLGQTAVDIVQGDTIVVSCVINDKEYEFDNIIYIDDTQNISSAEINLQIDLYESIIELKNLNFESAKYDIKQKYYTDLNDIYGYLKQEKNINIEIAGHTDNIGDEVYNQKLSNDRALSVKSFLVQKGIDSKRIKCVGYGEQQPIADNSTEFGREKNRRIEIRILK